MGAIAASAPANAELIKGTVKEVALVPVKVAAERKVTFVKGKLRLEVALAAGAAGCWYEWEIARAMAGTLRLRERPMVEQLAREIVTWEKQLKSALLVDVKYEVDWDGFCSREPEKNLFALTLLKEHGVDHLFYAVSGLCEKNPNFKAQFIERVNTLRLVSVGSAEEKGVAADGSALVLRLFLHEGYNGYLTIKELEKELPKLVVGMRDMGFAREGAAAWSDHGEPAEVPTEHKKKRAKKKPEDDPELQELLEMSAEDGERIEREAQEEREKAEQFAQMKVTIDGALAVYRQQMVMMVGKAVSVEIDWESVDGDQQAAGELLNAGLTPTIGGMAILGQDAAMRKAIKQKVERIVLQRATRGTGGVLLNAGNLFFVVRAVAGMPPMEPAVAAKLMGGVLRETKKAVVKKTVRKTVVEKKKVTKKKGVAKLKVRKVKGKRRR